MTEIEVEKMIKDYVRDFSNVPDTREVRWIDLLSVLDYLHKLEETVGIREGRENR